MKQVSSIAACVAAVFALAAIPARAQDSALITQVDAIGNNAVIEQIASLGNNYAAIDQLAGAYEGSGNVAQVLQQGVGQSEARIVQSGQMNDYRIRQYDGQGLRAEVNTEAVWDVGLDGEYNMVLIEQTGFDSSARVDVGGNSSYNRADIVQLGWGGQNQARIVQYYSNNNMASIFQAGGNLDASIVQGRGSGNMATIRQGQ